MSKGNKPIAEVVAADNKSIGFDYQYYYFLWKLLSLNCGEKIGLEVKDDVHIELQHGLLEMIQLKHTVQTKADGAPKNMSTLDYDLWHTLSNWAKFISDENDGRKKVSEQKKFLSKTSFIIFSNKSTPEDNEFIAYLSSFHSGENKLSPKAFIQNLCSKSDNANINNPKNNHVLALDPDVLELFLQKISIDLDQDDIINNCLEAIKSDKIPDHKIKHVFSEVDSYIRKNNYIEIKKGNKVCYSFDDYYNRCRRYYDLARNEKLEILPFTLPLSENLLEQIFVKQLLEISDISPSCMDDICDFTRYMLQLANNLENWKKDGEITESEIQFLYTEASSRWRNKFRESYRHVSNEDEINRIAQSLIDALREEMFNIEGQDIGVNLSNGLYYHLSDQPALGWRKDWEKYKT